MAELEIPKDISVQDFFESFVPETFDQVIKENPVPGMEGTVFTMQVNLTGEGGATYGLTVKDAKEIKVEPGPMDSPMLAIQAPVLAWRAAISGTIEGANMFVNPVDFATRVDRKMYEAAKTTRGTAVFKPDLGEGMEVEMKIVFNGAERPRVVLIATPDVFDRMSTGDLSGPEAVMQNKLRLDGDVMFAMQLNTFLQPG